MQKPAGYDDAQAQGEFTPVELGGHYAIIKQVSETKASTRKDMIVVLIDFASNDKQAGYFGKLFAGDSRDDKKWPFAGTKYVMVNDYNDTNKTSRAFKTFCTCFEKSNGCKVQWGGADWGKQFRGKKIGVVYGEEEHEWDGRTTMRHVLRWFCGTDAVEGANIPEPKYLNKAAAATAPAAAGNDGFMNIPDGADEEIPF